MSPSNIMGAASGDLRVVVADDQAAFREVACGVVGEATGLRLVGCVDRVSAVPAVVAAERADALLLDVRMPGEDSLAMAAQLRRARPHLRILLVSADSVEDIPDDVFDLGIGFLAKDELEPDTLLAALHLGQGCPRATGSG